MVNWVNFDSQKKSWLLVIAATALIVVSLLVAFLRFFILRDYTIQSQIECDPYTESCFVYVCDPAAEECTGDPVQDTFYYKLLNREAYNIPLCDPNTEGCNPLICSENENGCYVTFCDPNLPEAPECTNPEQFIIDHPQSSELNTEEE